MGRSPKGRDLRAAEARRAAGEYSAPTHQRSSAAALGQARRTASSVSAMPEVGELQLSGAGDPDCRVRVEPDSG